MKKYKVNIDLSSIKKNKDAGQTTTIIPGKKTVSFWANQLPEYFKDGENCIIIEHTIKNGMEEDFEGIITSEDLFQKCLDEKPDVTISVNVEHHRINHLPIPKYSYKYENIKIVCNNCGKEIYTNDLEADEVWDGRNEHFSSTVCPKCGTFDCCHLVFETIEEALKRKNKK